MAGTLLFSGLIHASQPYLFIHTISAYRITPVVISGLIGLWLPYFQILVAVFIAINHSRRVAFLAAAGLFTSFSLAQFSVLIRGIQIDCGCFGFIASKVTFTSALFPFVLAGMSLWSARVIPEEVQQHGLVPQKHF